MLKHILLVGLGGGVGSMLRYTLTLWISKGVNVHTFPWATFAINVSGCLLIGFFAGLSVRYVVFQNELRYLLIAGFCGGYTTFSAFSAESFSLIEQGRYFTVALYIISSVLLGVLAFYAAYQASKVF